MVDKSSSSPLGDRFRALWKRSLPPAVKMNVTPVYDDLVRHYNEPFRYYHGWSHLTHCLREFDRTAAWMETPDAVELALWFHDAVYVPGARDNEQLSADLFSQWGRTWFSPTLVDKVCGYILITMHRQTPDNGDESYMVDIDLSSFGEQWSTFLRDTRNVRKEQAHVPDAIYYPAHARFLKMLLNRPRIFYTDFFFECYEQSARRNIERLLTSTRYPDGVV
jgi:predicted metal-dependent HD superfamily phosphohydrolase